MIFSKRVIVSNHMTLPKDYHVNPQSHQAVPVQHTRRSIVIKRRSTTNPIQRIPVLFRNMKGSSNPEDTTFYITSIENRSSNHFTRGMGISPFLIPPLSIPFPLHSARFFSMSRLIFSFPLYLIAILLYLHTTI